MSIAENLEKIKASLPPQITLVAVSKTKSNQEILEAYTAGQRIFGENKIQEMTRKWSDLPKDIEWHMIGHVQSNKVKFMAPFVSLVHGVDSLKLLQEINIQAGKQKRNIPCLLQIHIAEEESKFGFNEDELLQMVHSGIFKTLEHITIKGLMGMATFTDDETQVRKEFKNLKSVYQKLKETLNHMTILSMGMSGDYKIAIEEGSTMVRIGSSIFGVRT
jgi:pyridoxal phosphate enzyme (YggS family)